jgi:hypothetical protein
LRGVVFTSMLINFWRLNNSLIETADIWSDNFNDLILF